MVTEINDANFEEFAKQEDLLIIMEFGANWCGPCKVIAPIIEEIYKEYEGKVVIGKMDVDNNVLTPAKYGIRNIPTILFFKNGELVDKQVGAGPKTIITGKIDTLLSANE
jgi:thioredoxin 1